MALETVRLSAILGIGGGGARGLFGPYRLLDQLGAGAYAVVYRARHELIGIERALKLLRPPVAADPERRDLLLREARVAARLQHPNVVGVHDCGVAADGTPYIVMDYVAGRSLAARLGAGTPRPAETLHVAGQLAAALDHAHRRAVVHRDVKPANVLLGDDGVVRLGDFGIAQAGHEADDRRTWAGLGTPAYMAPEQRLGQRCDVRTDVYGLAALLHEMLTGRPPCSGGDPAAALPSAVGAVLASGLAIDPARRPASAGRLVAALSAAFGRAPRRGLASSIARGVARNLQLQR